MAKPSTHTTSSEDEAISWSRAARYVTRLSGGSRTVVAHGATPEESEHRAARMWETRDKRLADAAHSGADEGLRVAFEELAESWSAGTAHLSSPTRLIEHPAYRQIIGLGPAVLPFILRDLAETGRFWFPALNAITGENPIPDDASGDVEKSAEAWISWGRTNSLV
jgi:hypothetical protein